MSDSTLDPRPGDFAAAFLTEALRDGRATLLSPGRVPKAGKVWIGWTAGSEVFLPQKIPARVLLELFPDGWQDFPKKYRALLREGRPVRLEVPTEFEGDVHEGRLAVVARLQSRALVRLPTDRLGACWDHTTPEEFALAEKALAALCDVQTQLLRLRGVGDDWDSITVTAGKLAPYVELAMLRKGKRP